MKMECVAAATLSTTRQSNVARHEDSTGAPVASSDPAGLLEPVIAVDVGGAGKDPREVLLVTGQHVDREHAALLDHAVGLGAAVDARQKLRRLGRDGAHRGRGEPGALPSWAEVIRVTPEASWRMP